MSSRTLEPISSRASGAALVEFALVAFVLYVLLAATVELGRSIHGAQAVQTVARAAARELAVTPLPALGNLDDLLNAPLSRDPSVEQVRREIYDPCKLVIDLDRFDDAAQLDAFFAGLPIVNQLLRPLMIADEVGGQRLLRYPGALLVAPEATCLDPTDTGFVVAIPQVLGRDDVTGTATSIRWLNVIEEILDPATETGRFSVVEGGLVALRVNYPFQSTMLSGYRAVAPSDEDPLPPNVSRVIRADDAGITETNAPLGTPALAGDTRVGAYTGRYGLGRQLAFGTKVRPFRRLISATAIFRREALSP